MFSFIRSLLFSCLLLLNSQSTPFKSRCLHCGDERIYTLQNFIRQQNTITIDQSKYQIKKKVKMEYEWWRMFLPCGERLEVRFRLLFFILVRCSTVISRTSALSTLVPDSVRSGTSTFSSSKHLLIRARLLFSIIGFGILPACKNSGLQLWQIVGWERSQL